MRLDWWYSEEKCCNVGSSKENVKNPEILSGTKCVFGHCARADGEK